MVTKCGKSPVGQKLNESFEDKLERRLEFHEVLRSRHNLTSCRQDNPHWGKEQEKHTPREQEFLRRRHIWHNETEEKRVPKKRDSREPVMSNVRQVAWHHNRSNTYPFDHINMQFNFLNNNNHTLAPLYHINTRNDVATMEKGVQTVQDVLVTSIRRDSSQQTDCAVSVLNGELQQLSDYLMEALQRERKLKKKLCALQDLLSVLLQTSEMSWKTLKNEDHLKSKVAALENQLFLCTQNFSKASIHKNILLEIEENKLKYHEKAKKSIQKLTDKKIATEAQLKNSQMNLLVSTDECEFWKEEYEKLKADWTELSNKHCEMTNEMNVMQSKLQWVAHQDAQLQQLQNHLQTLQQERIELETSNEQLRENCEIQKERLSSLQARLRNAEEKKLQMQDQFKALQNELAALERRCQSNISTKIVKLQRQDDAMQSDRFKLIMEKLNAKEDECAGLKAEVELITEEYKSCQRKLQQCREELKKIHRRKPKRRSSCWLPFFLIFAVIAAYILSTELKYTPL